MIETETLAGDTFLKRLSELKEQGRVVLRMKQGATNSEWEFVHDDASRYEKNHPGEQPELFGK